MKILFPIFIFLSITNRPVSNLLYVNFSILGIFLIFSRKKKKADIIWIFFIISQLFFNFTGNFIPNSITSIYLESKYLLIYPCGIFMKFLCNKYINKESFNFYKILLIGLGFYLLIFKGFQPRFGGGERLPLLGNIWHLWPPTYSLAIMYVILQIDFKIKNLFNTLLLLFFIQSSIVSNTLAVLYVYLKNNLINNLIFLILKLKLKKKILYVVPILVFLLIYLYYIIFYRRPELFLGSLDLLKFDRIAFYFSYFLTYLNPITDINNLYSLFTGWGIGTNVASWVDNLPILFFEPIKLIFDGFVNSSLIFQIEFLRVLYSHGIIGILFIIFLIKEMFVSEENINKQKFDDSTHESILKPDLVIAILITSLLTITFSSSANFLTFAFTVFASPYNIRSNSKAIKNH